MLSGLRNPEACFLFGIKAFFIEHREYNDLRRPAEGGHDAAAYLYAILLYRDNGGVVAWKKYGFEFLCFAAKTVGSAAKW
jgi:hypothetical protein